MENISVSVRVRPMNEAETEKGSAWRVEGNCIQPIKSREVSDDGYSLDNIFDSSWTTQQVYQHTTEDLVHKVVGGFNGTVFAYGQTSSGKTHTMHGSAEEPGIIPLAVSAIFEHIAATQEREFLLRVSYMELYNEEVGDLLAVNSGRLQVHESREAGVYVAGLREEIVTSAEHVLGLLQEGERARHTGETKMNKHSSRSHTVFRMVVESRSRDPDSIDGGAVWVSTLTLVDLAGSERVAKTGAEGMRMKEGTSINKSLLTLGNVINKLSEGALAQGQHIPYRDSKLTRILQPSLGGNAKTAIICAITPAALHTDETHSTLRFACRAKRVVNHASVNEVLSDAAVLKRQAREIEDLRKVLAANGGAGNAEVEAQIASLRAELLHREQENERVQTQLAKEKEERERAERQVSGLTKLLEGGGEAGAGSTKENRRETWCPGNGGRPRKRPLAANTSIENLAEGSRAAALSGRKSGPEKGDGGALDLDINSPLHQRQRRSSKGSHSSSSLGGLSGEGEIASDLPLGDLLAEAPGGSGEAAASGEDVQALKARIRELAVGQGLMQRELDHMTDLAHRSDGQLRAAEEELCSVGEERDRLAPQVEEAKWKARQAEKEAAELTQRLAATLQGLEDLQTELDSEKQAAAERVANLEAELAAATASSHEAGEQAEKLHRISKEAAEKAAADMEKLEAKLTHKQSSHAQEVAELQEQLRTAASAKEQLAKTAQDWEERAADTASALKESAAEVSRLQDHVNDLESRKRAPLYQKRQEEELRAAVEKAAEAETRAREAKAERQSAEKAVDLLTEQFAAAQKAAQKAALVAAEQLHVLEQGYAAELARLQAAHEGQTEAQRSTAAAQLEEQRQLRLQLEAELHVRSGELETASALVEEFRVSIVALQASQSESQACAEAASEQLAALETQLTDTNASHQEALATAASELEAARQEAMQATAATEETTRAALEEAARQLGAVQEAAQAAAVAAAQRLEEAGQGAEDLRMVIGSIAAEKAELEAKLGRAAAGLKAADELRDLKNKYREETQRLKQELSAAHLSSKGGQQASDRSKKELEKTRERLTSLEGKLRTAIQEKSSISAEKGALERELKALKGQSGRFTKDLEKEKASFEKKRESLASDLHSKKSALSGLEAALARNQVDLEKLRFELEVKKGECTSVSEELEARSRESQERQTLVDNLQAQVEEAARVHAALSTEHVALQELLAGKDSELAEAALEKVAADEQLRSLSTTLQNLQAAKASTDADLEATQSALQRSRDACDAAEARLPEIPELERQLKASGAEQADLQYQARTAAAVAAEKLAALQKQLEGTQGQMDQLRGQLDGAAAEKAALQGQLTDASSAATNLEARAQNLELRLQEAVKECQEHVQYQQEIEGQLNEAELENNAQKATVQDLKTRLNSSVQDHSRTADKLRAASEQLQGKLEAVDSLQAQVGVLQQALEHATSGATAAAVSSEQRFQALQAQLDEAQRSAGASGAEWERRLGEAVSSAEQWKAYAEDLGIKKAGVEEDLATLQASLQSAEERAGDLSAQLEASQAAAEALGQLETDLRETLQQAQAAVEEEQLRALQASAQADSLQEAFSARIAHAQEETECVRRDLEGQLAALQQRLAKADTEVASERELLAASDGKVAALQARVEQAEEQIASAQRSLERAEAALDAAQNAAAKEAAVLQSAAGSAQEQALQALKEEFLRMAAERESQRAAEVAASEQNLASVQAELAFQVNHIQEARAAKAAAEAAVHVKESELEAMRQDLAQLAAQLEQTGNVTLTRAAASDPAVALVRQQAQQRDGLLRARLNAHQARQTTTTPAVASTSAPERGAPSEREAQLEAELRRSKRREEKLAALQYRLREDLKECNDDLAAFDRLRDVRGLEYELDFVTNRAAREQQVLRKQLEDQLLKVEALQATMARGNY